MHYAGVNGDGCISLYATSSCLSDNEVGLHRTRLLLHAGLEHVGLFGAPWLGLALQDDADHDAALGFVHNLSAAVVVRLRVPTLGPPFREVNSHGSGGESVTP